MLYTTTRNSRDTYTAHRILKDRRGTDGGFFVPFRIPVFSEEEIRAFSEKSFNTCVADILNIFFNTRLTSFDLDFSIGRYAVRLKMLSQRIIVAECWHNPNWQFECLVNDLFKLICNDQDCNCEPGEWAEIAIRIAILFGIFGELIRNDIAGNEKKIDISAVSGDFSAPMSAWYAREMGLPIGNIICSCNENGSLWNFICHGQLRTDGVAVKTCVPEADIVVPAGIERLLFSFGGFAEVERYLDAVRQGKMYYVDDKFLQQLRQGIYVTVASGHRVLEMIPNVYATHNNILSASAALAYIGLQDYRARTGECRDSLVLTEKSPRADMDVVSHALGCTTQKLVNLL